jgi:hypothetical protein
VALVIAANLMARSQSHAQDEVLLDRTVCGSWDIAYGKKDAETQPRASYFLGAVSISSSNLWAIGSGGSQSQPIVQQWDGKVWTILSNERVNSISGAYLTDVDATAANDVWAVGYYFQEPSGSDNAGLILHWDGKVWTEIPVPTAGLHELSLDGVTAIAANDAWVVGSYVDPSASSRSLALHWDGQTWTVAPTPIVGAASNRLDDVLGIATNDVWAVGASDWQGTPGNDTYEGPFALHWDGKSWSSVSIPSISERIGSLSSISASGSNDVWAVGQGYRGKGRVLHWNGTDWRIVNNPIIDSDDTDLTDVLALAPNDVWATGFIWREHRSMVVHWNGSQWGFISSLGPDGPDTEIELTALTAASPNDLWAVGDTRQDLPLLAHPLAAHFIREPCEGLGH